jgi:hypothetical protein
LISDYSSFNTCDFWLTDNETTSQKLKEEDGKYLTKTAKKHNRPGFDGEK